MPTEDEMVQEDETEESARHIVILGAGFSKAVDCRMPTSDELGDEVRERLDASGNGLPAELTRGSFEEWLSRLAEDQPDLLEHEVLREFKKLLQKLDPGGGRLDLCLAEVL